MALLFFIKICGCMSVLEFDKARKRQSLEKQQRAQIESLARDLMSQPAFVIFVQASPNPNDAKTLSAKRHGNRDWIISFLETEHNDPNIVSITGKSKQKVKHRIISDDSLLDYLIRLISYEYSQNQVDPHLNEGEDLDPQETDKPSEPSFRMGVVLPFEMQDEGLLTPHQYELVSFRSASALYKLTHIVEDARIAERLITNKINSLLSYTGKPIKFADPKTFGKTSLLISAQHLKTQSGETFWRLNLESEDETVEHIAFRNAQDGLTEASIRTMLRSHAIYACLNDVIEGRIHNRPQHEIDEIIQYGCITPPEHIEIIGREPIPAECDPKIFLPLLFDLG